MPPGPQSHLRLARPSADLSVAELFWVGGLGLEVLWRSADDPEGGHDLLAVGWPTAAWHLELVEDPASVPAPSEEDLLVLYVDGPVGAAVERLVAAGGRAVPSRNPYWDTWGATVLDPDGYRLVLSHRSWT